MVLFLVIFSSVGRPKHVRVMAGALEGDIFIGPKAEVIHIPTEEASSQQRTFIVHHMGSVSQELDIAKSKRNNFLPFGPFIFGLVLPGAASALRKETSGTHFENQSLENRAFAFLPFPITAWPVIKLIGLVTFLAKGIQRGGPG
jgi:hypothetical protein